MTMIKLTISLEVPNDYAARWERLRDDEREAITAGPVITAFEQALDNKMPGSLVSEEEARQRRRQAGEQFLAMTEKGFYLGGIKISRDELYERD